MGRILNKSKPIKTSSSRDANSISILSGHKYFYEWLFTSHIQLQLNKVPGSDYHWLVFYSPIENNYYRLIETQFTRTVF